MLSRSLNHSDHPRSRGVYKALNALFRGVFGSSPLARGLPAQQMRRRVSSGIIPARAGFTGRSGHLRRRGRDHPRSRGVYQWTVRVAVRACGSSPLARGLQAGEAHGGGPVGIIPARAGFTGRRPTARRRSGDHPRSRGVYTAAVSRSPRPDGSSPLARGLRVHRRARGRRRPDHPRSRGVYLRPPGRRRPTRGSSPLARGLRLGQRRVGGVVGIIPARAGFTGGDHRPPNAPRDHPRSRGVYSWTVRLTR